MKNKEKLGNDRASTSLENFLFPDEIAHLDIIKEKIDAAEKKANDQVVRMDREYMDAKRYMADYRGEIDPHEMFQNELALKQIDRTGAFSVGRWEKLAKLKASPYFARIDFQPEGVELATKYYIGSMAFSHENELLIVDWRAPIASIFYDCEIGPGGYEAPMGRINGNLTRKRQFKVKNGILEYTLESSMNINDDVLQRELSHTSNEKMKSIIATIQKEQNQIIRNEKAKTMIIQGVAGSGKTSIALHRIAFLLYRFKENLSAREVMILSPNKVFGDYISTVLPELGEEQIREFSFEDIAEIELEGVIDFEQEKDPLEIKDEKWAERVAFKSTMKFIESLDQYLEEVSSIIFRPEDYSFGRFRVRADWIEERFFTYRRDPIKKRLVLIANDIYDRFDSDNFMGDELPKLRTILKSLNGMLKIKSSLSLYKGFYQWLEHPELFFLPKKKTLEWADVYPFLYLRNAFEGLKESRVVKHLVIDEMQDYPPIQYAVINHLFPCQKTILGDFGQLINPNHRHTLADLKELYREGNLVELTKSYRSTYEIMLFAMGIQKPEKLEPMKRHGEAPLVIPCVNKEDELSKVRERLETFLNGGGTSLGIILKTNSGAKAFYESFTKEYNYGAQLISFDSTNFLKGISITSIQMSKGLEFDEVIIPDVREGTYQTKYDRSLLYVACTRAMHRLTLLYTGTPSPFIPKSIKEA